MVAFICKAVWIRVIRASHVDAARRLIHYFDEGVDATLWCFENRRLTRGLIEAFRTVCLSQESLGEVLSEDHGRIVTTRKHQSMKQVPNGQDLSIY